MISRRLTKTQKAEILDAYRIGENSNQLAEKYNCTPNTINRTVKTLLSESEYTLLKKSRPKIINKKDRSVSNKISKEKNEDKEKILYSLIPTKEEVKQEDTSIKVNEETHKAEVYEISSLSPVNTEESAANSRSRKKHNKNDAIDESSQNFDNNFEEIEPLIDCFDFNQNQKESDFEILNYESLPESVYMIVDKKVELDFQPISDLPEWSFLPENELKRNAILLFSNQRSAKRICTRNQRVIKIPNTGVFQLSKSYLISKGITRLILEDSIIGLDN